jgi:hypothetical protein
MLSGERAGHSIRPVRQQLPSIRNGGYSGSSLPPSSPPQANNDVDSGVTPGLVDLLDRNSGTISDTAHTLPPAETWDSSLSESASIPSTPGASIVSPMANPGPKG